MTQLLLTSARLVLKLANFNATGFPYSWPMKTNPLHPSQLKIPKHLKFRFAAEISCKASSFSSTTILPDLQVQFPSVHHLFSYTCPIPWKNLNCWLDKLPSNSRAIVIHPSSSIVWIPAYVIRAFIRRFGRVTSRQCRKSAINKSITVSRAILQRSAHQI